MILDLILSDNKTRKISSTTLRIIIPYTYFTLLSAKLYFPATNTLYTGVLLLVLMARVILTPFIPILTHLLCFIQLMGIPWIQLSRRSGALQNLHCQPFGRVPRNVTVHKPRSRVIGFESNDDETILRYQNCIATGRVIEVESS